ncbi:hypothetical protein DH2020_024462 [Rehmannia glutinosa]|uniref:Retrotransposon gag domain-containing protein n=1 Tax=Rehmannia glutinosa TaxID=99300 RepID=A0ABR0W393_REHGL
MKESKGSHKVEKKEVQANGEGSSKNPSLKLMYAQTPHQGEITTSLFSKIPKELSVEQKAELAVKESRKAIEAEFEKVAEKHSAQIQNIRTQYDYPERVCPLITNSRWNNAKYNQHNAKWLGGKPDRFPVSGNELVQRLKGSRKLLQPKDPSATPFSSSTNNAKPKPNPSEWIEVSQRRVLRTFGLKFAKIQTKVNKLDGIEDLLETLMRDKASSVDGGGDSSSSLPTPNPTPPPTAPTRIAARSCRPKNPENFETHRKYQKLGNFPKPETQNPKLIAALPKTEPKSSRVASVALRSREHETERKRERGGVQKKKKKKKKRGRTESRDNEVSRESEIESVKTRCPDRGGGRSRRPRTRKFETHRKYETQSLAATTQTGTVDEYVDMFISRAAHVHGLSDSHSLGLFLNGLRNDIRIRIRSKDAADLFDTIHLTREIERKLQAPRGSRFGPTQPHTTSSGFTPGALGFHAGGPTPRNPTTPPLINGPTQSHSVGSPRNPPTPDSHFPATSVASSGSSRPNRGVRQLSHADYLDLKAKGLCFKCREPYHPLHNCPTKSLRVMIAAERDGEEPPRELEYTDQLDSSGELAPTELQWLELSPLAAGGFDGPRALKVMALLQESRFGS